MYTIRLTQAKLILPLALLLLIVATVLFAGGATGSLSVQAAPSEATIGGGIFTGSQNPDGTPNTTTAAPLSGAQVMVQNQHSGGAFITYGTVTGNSWTATVPAPGDYVVMFSAPDHDATSREFTVDDGDVLTKDAFLPPLPLATANLLVYAFYDNYVNGEPDDYPEDIHLNGVEFTVKDEAGNVLATGVTGTQTPIILAGADSGSVITETDGLYYFTGLPPGEVIVTSDPKYVCSPVPGQRPQLPALEIEDPATCEFYLNTSEEGGPAWDPKLFPGDSGTEDGGFLLWHGYVEKLGQITPGNVEDRFGPGASLADAGSISGVMIDADAILQEAVDPGEVEEVEAFLPVPGEDHPGVTANTVVPDGLIILFFDQETTKTRPVAVIEADPVTGEFTFDNVPPGRYKMMSFDVPLDYVWTQQQVRVPPNEDVVLEDIAVLVPRFFARGEGYVYDSSTGLPMPDQTVNLRYKSGIIKREQTTNSDGSYNFDNLPEIEVLGHVDVDLPPGYRGAMITEPFYPEGSPLVFHEDTNGNGILDPGEDIFPNDNGVLDHYVCAGDPNPFPGVYTEVPCVDVTHNAMNRYMQWYTMNYQSDFYLEPIPVEEGDVRGVVYYDHLARGTWTGDGAYEPAEERTMHGVTVELWDAAGTTLLDTTTTGSVDKTALAALGWTPAYSMPPDEFGGVFPGDMPGFYEFRGLEPGDYTVKVISPDGFSPSPAGSDVAIVTVAGGNGTDHNVGINTLVPLAGEIEGGVFDDLNLDEEPLSLLHEEKAGIPGVPVGVYDHLGYNLGVGYMGHPYCYAGSTICPSGEASIQKPEMERRFAPGVHIYFGNDPDFPGFNPCYTPLVLAYTFDQGAFKFEADWSLIPNAFLPGGGWLDCSHPLPSILPAGGPVIDAVTPGGSYVVTGSDFGDEQGYSTVTLSGRELLVTSWSDTEIHVDDPPDAVSGPLVVTTTEGPSNAVHYDTGYVPAQSVFVDASNTGTEDGSEANPWNTIGEALDNLPAATPRYVFVAAGTYDENLWVRESDIKIIGAGPLETTIDGLTAPSNSLHQGIANGGGPVFYIGVGGGNSWENRDVWRQAVENVMISGFTITGSSVAEDDRAGYEIGAGIFADYGNSNIDINNNVIVRNGGYYGGAIWLHKSNRDVDIWSNTIAENGNFGGYSGGISVNDEPFYPEFFPESGPRAGMRMSEAHGEPEHVWDDSCDAATTVVMASSYKKIDGDPGCEPWGAYEIYNNHIFNNFSPDSGGGIALYEVKDRLNIFGNLIEDNWADDHGGGAFFEDSGPIDIHENKFLRNYSRDDGGAISFEDVGDDIALINISNNLFAENIADDCGENTARGGALAFDDTFYVEIFNNTIVDNIVAGSRNPAGGGIDSERHGHEYNGSQVDIGGLDIAPGFSDPKIYNNIIWGNMRLTYDQPLHGDEEDLCNSWGRNQMWTADNMHVDNPALQAEWESENNSESFTLVEFNDLSEEEYSDRDGNITVDPQFADPSSDDWHLTGGSPVIAQVPADTAPRIDLDRRCRTPEDGMVDMGAYEFEGDHPSTITIAKEADPADGTDFAFVGDLGSFSLDDSDPFDGDGITPTIGYAGLCSGTYTVMETLADGWELLDVECTSTSTSITDDTDSLTGAAVNLEADEHVTCTFVNEGPPTASEATPTPAPSAAAAPVVTPPATPKPEVLSEATGPAALPNGGGAPPEFGSSGGPYTYVPLALALFGLILTAGSLATVRVPRRRR